MRSRARSADVRDDAALADPDSLAGSPGHLNFIVGPSVSPLSQSQAVRTANR